MKQIGGLTVKAMRKSARIRGFSEAELLAKWREIVPAYSQFSRPMKLQKGTLVIATSSASAAHNMQMQGQPLLDRINQFFGYDAVKNLRFIIRHFEPEEIKQIKLLNPDPDAVQAAMERCKLIESEDLRHVYEELGALIEMEKRIQK